MKKFTPEQQKEINQQLDSLSQWSGIKYTVNYKLKSIVANGSNHRYWFNSFEDLRQKLWFARDVLYCMANYGTR